MILAIAWYLGGFTTGLIAGRHLATKGTHPMIVHVRDTTWQWVREHVVSVAMAGFIIGIIGVPAAIIFSNHQTNGTIARFHAQAQCQDAYSQRLVAIIKARASASQGAVLAPSPFIDKILELLHSKGLTDAEKATLLAEVTHSAQHAKDAYDQYAASQQAHPLPPLPDQFCAD